MASQNENLVSKAMKRSYGSNNKEILDPKKPKTEVSPLRLIDVNDDCLRLIFEKLSLEDLINVAEAHERFIPAAESVFSRRYRNQKFMVSSILTEHSCIIIEKDVAVRLIRHFGDYVSNLLVDCLSQHDEEVEEMIAKHCASSLVNLGLTFVTTNFFKGIETPFEKVEKLTVDRGMLSSKLSQLDVWCPNVTSLELFNVELLEPTSLEVHFTQLKELKLHNEIITIPKANVIGMLRLNPQLELLRLKQFEYDVDMIQSVSELLPALKEFEIWSPEDRFFNFGEQKIRFDAVKKFTVKSLYYRPEFIECMPFEFKELEELTLDGFNEYNGSILNFVLENNGLTKLSLTPFVDDFDDLTYDDLCNIVRSLPKLTELKFCADMISKHDIISFLKNSKNLKTVRLLYVDLKMFKRIRPEAHEFGNEWNVTVHAVHNEHQAKHFCLKCQKMCF